MKRGALLLLFLGGCGCAPAPKGAGTGPTTPAADTTVHVNDPSVVCNGTEVDFGVKLAFAEGCAPLVGPDGPAVIDEIGFVLDGDPKSASADGPLEMGTKLVGFEANGCGAHITMTGDNGVLDLAIAAAGSDSQDISGTGTWTPAGAAPCAVTVTGDYTSAQ